MMKLFYHDVSGHYQNDSAPSSRHKASLNGSVKIIFFDLYSHSTEFIVYGDFIPLWQAT